MTDTTQQSMPRTAFSAEHALYRSNVARFIAERISPHHAECEEAGLVPRQLWRDAGAAGLLCPGIPEE